MKPQELNLNCEVFDVFRMRMDLAINALMRNMIEKDMMTGNITAKIDVELMKKVTDDGEVIWMPEIKPCVNLKIGAKCKLECPTKGGFMMKQGNEGFIIGTNQVSMDELMDGKEGST